MLFAIPADLKRGVFVGALAAGLGAISFRCAPATGTVYVDAVLDLGRPGTQLISASESAMAAPTVYSIQLKRLECSMDGNNWTVLFQGDQRFDLVATGILLAKGIPVQTGTYTAVRLLLGLIEARGSWQGQEVAGVYSGLAGRYVCFRTAEHTLPLVELPAAEKHLVLNFLISRSLGLNSTGRLTVYEPGLELSVQ